MELNQEQSSGFLESTAVRPFRALRFSFLAPLMMAFAAAATARAANLVVNSNNDVNDGACGPQHCSLRKAIIAANAIAGPDTITFSLGTATIFPTSALPALTDQDGTTIRGGGWTARWRDSPRASSSFRAT